MALEYLVQIGCYHVPLVLIELSHILEDLLIDILAAMINVLILILSKLTKVTSSKDNPEIVAEI